MHYLVKVLIYNVGYSEIIRTLFFYLVIWNALYLQMSGIVALLVYSCRTLHYTRSMIVFTLLYIYVCISAGKRGQGAALSPPGISKLLL